MALIIEVILFRISSFLDRKRDGLLPKMLEGQGETERQYIGESPLTLFTVRPSQRKLNEFFGSCCLIRILSLVFWGYAPKKAKFSTKFNEISRKHEIS